MKTDVDCIHFIMRVPAKTSGIADSFFLRCAGINLVEINIILITSSAGINCEMV